MWCIEGKDALLKSVGERSVSVSMILNANLFFAFLLLATHASLPHCWHPAGQQIAVPSLPPILPLTPPIASQFSHLPPPSSPRAASCSSVLAASAALATESVVLAPGQPSGGAGMMCGMCMSSFCACKCARMDTHTHTHTHLTMHTRTRVQGSQTADASLLCRAKLTQIEHKGFVRQP